MRFAPTPQHVRPRQLHCFEYVSQNGRFQNTRRSLRDAAGPPKTAQREPRIGQITREYKAPQYRAGNVPAPHALSRSCHAPGASVKQFQRAM